MCGTALAAALDIDFLGKIPCEKFLTKINTPRVRENVQQVEVVACTCPTDKTETN
jgi:hypothetical protein